MGKEKKKQGFKGIIGGVFAFIFVALLAVSFILDGYTYLMGRVHTLCEFEGAYIYEEDDATIVVTFSGDEMVMYLWNRSGSTRTQYKYRGTYYNRGIDGRFLDNDDNWVKISNADKAGEFYADCKSFVSAYWTGENLYMNEAEIDEAGEENDIHYSRTFLFKIYNDTLTLIMSEGEDFIHIPMEKAVVLIGEPGETVEYLDYLWGNHFQQ